MRHFDWGALASGCGRGPAEGSLAVSGGGRAGAVGPGDAQILGAVEGDRQDGCAVLFPGPGDLGHGVADGGLAGGLAQRSEMGLDQDFAEARGAGLDAEDAGDVFVEGRGAPGMAIAARRDRVGNLREGGEVGIAQGRPLAELAPEEVVGAGLFPGPE